MYTEKELTDALNKAKLDLMSQLKRTFITTIVWSLKQSFSDAIPTAATNGIDLIINPDWFMELTRKQRTGLLAHEAWHVALEHMVRGESFDHKLYNIAADYVINIMEQDLGTELPPHGYVDAAYRNMTTEQVYNIIYKKQDELPSYPMDLIMNEDAEGESQNDGQSQSDIKAKIESILIKAHIQAEAADEPLVGNVPSELVRRLDDLLNPKLPWGVILQNYVNTYAKIDYSFQRPNKKFMDVAFLPTLSGHNIEHICIAVDSSGSVLDKEFTAFLQEIVNIKDSVNPNKLTLIDFDTDIKHIYNVDSYTNLLDLEFKGYGGTALEPAFEKAKELNPTLFIVFSDLDCRRIEEETPFPVIWVCVNNPKAAVKFGHKIDLELAA